MALSVGYWKLSCKLCSRQAEGVLCKKHADSQGERLVLKANQVVQNKTGHFRKNYNMMRKQAMWDKD